MSDIPKAITQEMVRTLHAQGLERTPVEVAEDCKEMYASLREQLCSQGIACPDGDLEFLEWFTPQIEDIKELYGPFR